MLFKISHVKADGTMAKIQNVEAGSLYGAYKAYLEEHKGVDVMAVFNAGDKDAVKAVKAGSKSKEDKTMKTNSAVNTAKAAKKTSKKTAPKAEIKKTPVVKKAQAQTESVEAKATFTLNEEHNGIEIKFNEKPSKEVREQLKGLKFRWHQTKGLWYAKQSAETIALAEKLCGVKAEEPKAKASKKTAKKSEPKAQAKAESKAQPKAEEPKAETKKPSRKGIESYKAKEGERITDRLIKALNRTEGIVAELVVKNEGEDGWLWVTGEGTKEHKDKLKSLGFFWSGKKQAWYMSPAPLKRNYKAQFNSMDALRGAALA